MARRKLPLWYVPVAIAALVLIVQLASLAAPAGSRDRVAQLADATARPTRTMEPTATAPPATATPVTTAPATHTPLPPTTTPMATPTAATQTYVVKPGDTLSGIANDHGLTTAELAEANELGAGAMLSIGQELIIPAPPGEEPEVTPTPGTTATTGAADTTPEPANTPVPTTVAPTDTPVPPTAAPVEPTAVPPTAAPPPPTASPAGIVQQIEVDNGEWGKGFILFKFAGDTEFFVKGSDGHRYRPFMGFLSNPQAIAKAQETWTWAGRGSASWRMIVELREKVGWVSCSGNDRVCWEEAVHSGMASITSQVYLHPDQWAELINAYNGGGVEATTRVSHYDEIQKTVFDPIFRTVPDIATIGFRFERID